ncbi:MAG TPA: O-antigen ligase family protein [Bradyrhizobium sp.]|uniref:O-antigen ligase family protein n=1 Tax=Bradyrhizobium sp. TaxID=376 RepID=UPI002BCDB0DB|nr:O-antigen ligase family protein [Bradyrhizobium sp.]HLZ02224.1 O-antigen ligase family protein [Bradyrhizobium sp.]
MTEAVRTDAAPSRLSVVWSALNDPAAQIRRADWLAGLIAVLLPWTTTGVGIAVVLWLIAFAPTVEPRALLQSFRRPVSALPIALFALVLLGTLWSDAPWHDQTHQLGQVSKFLVLPLLVYHFERSTRGLNVFIAFLISCLLLALVSCVVALEPNLSAKLYFSRGPYLPTSGIFVKNYIDQGQEFSLCAAALAYPVVTALRDGRNGKALLLAAAALALVANMIFVVTSRTALVTMPIMLVIFLLLHLRWRVAVAALCGMVLLATGAWYGSPHLRTTVGKFFIDYRETMVQNNESGMGSRLIYWGKSLKFFADAPVIGHGTGSTRGLFEKAAAGQIGAEAMVVSNPHNQTLNVAVQWGTVGVILLYALWIAHLLLFRREGLVSWIGLLVVIQNMLTSVLNSHLFDFNEGWIYVLGVGIAGGMTLARRVSPPARQASGSASA